MSVLRNNDNGRTDLVVANYDSNTVSVLRNNGNGTFAAKVDYATGAYPSSVTTADFNGDGRPDLAVANNISSDNTVSVLLGNSDGTFAAKVDYSTGFYPKFATAGDFNGDGKPDLAVANDYTVSVLLNRSPIGLSAQTVAENQPVGTMIGTISTDASSTSDTFTYSLVAGTGGTDNACFAIAGNQLTTAATLDYETKRSYSIRVRSTDQGGLWVENTFTINVTNVNETPTAVPGGPYTVQVGNSLTLDGSGSSDPDTSSGDHIASYAWDLNGDGVYTDLVSTSPTATASAAQLAALGLGQHTIGLKVTDSFGLSGTATTMLTVWKPPEILSIQIGDGTAQRSMVKSLTVTFDSAVTLDTGAFEVAKLGGGAVTVGVASNTVVNGSSRVVLNFSGTLTEFNSLKDGNYQLTVRGAKVHDAVFGQALDGDGDGQAGGDRVFGNRQADGFFRLLGDGNGDRSVDATDYAAFRTSINKRSTDAGYQSCFDSDGDGDVDNLDLARFRLRYQTTLAF